MRSPVRFSPPPVTLDPVLCWVLRRGFASPGAAVGDAAAREPRAALRAAVALDLAPRIGALVPFEQLVGETDEDVAAAFRAQARQALAQELLVVRLAETVAGCAQALGAPLVLLKGAALHLEGRIPPGARNTGDADVLVPATAARVLHQELVRRGCRAQPVPATEQHLPPLAWPGLGTVEVHTALRGVRLASGVASAGADEVLEAGLCQELPGRPGCWVPGDELMLAHLLVHGLAQHGMSGRYPLTRLAADLVDLGVDEPAWERFSQRGLGWLTGAVSTAESAGMVALETRLTRGEDPAVVAAGDDAAALLLRHAVTVTFDAGYRRSLRFASLAAPLPVAERWRSVARGLFFTLWLTRGQVDAIYGPHGWWGRQLLRLWRPFDLLRRAVWYLWSWLRLRRRASGRGGQGT